LKVEQDIGYSDRFFVVSLFPPGKYRILIPVGRDGFLPNPFQFIIQLSSNHPTLYSLDNKIAVKQLTKAPEPVWTTRKK
jgi:hypothetical protein